MYTLDIGYIVERKDTCDITIALFYGGSRTRTAGAHKLANGERCAFSRVLSSMRCTRSRVDPREM